MAGDVTDAGGDVRTRIRVRAISERGDRARIATSAGDTEARVVLVCAGLHADRMARLSGLDPGGRIVPFKGQYYRLADGAALTPAGSVENWPMRRFSHPPR